LVKLTGVARSKSVRKTGLKNVRPTKFRKSLEPGRVAILLAGAFRGKRVVVLKQLKSGTVLVNGPFSVNGVPLRRANPAYLIGTSTTVDIAGVDVKTVDDAFFKRTVDKSAKKKKNEEQFFAKKGAKELTPARKDMQKKVDAALEKSVKAAGLDKYLKHRFSLTSGMFPHDMKF